MLSQRSLISRQIATRGGSSYYEQSPPGGYPQVSPQTQSYSQDPPYTVSDDPMYHQTVQERVDHWKTQQQQYAASEEARLSPRDEQGRLKLGVTASRTACALTFFVLMLRNFHLYDVADKRRGLMRMLCMTPQIGLLLGNLAGLVVSMMSSATSTKKRLKSILNLNKLQELILANYLVLRLTVFPPKTGPRDELLACLFHSLFFFMQSHAVTRLSWDESLRPVTTYSQVPYNQQQTAFDRQVDSYPMP